METQMVDLLGGARVLGESLQSNLDLVRATRGALPAETASRLAELISGSAAGIGMIAPCATDPTGRLIPEPSDIVVRTATVLALAIDILGDKKKAAHWLTTSNRALGGEISDYLA